MFERFLGRSLSLAACFFLLFQLPAVAASKPSPDQQASRRLVEEVIYNELNAGTNDHSRYTYRVRKETPKGSTVKQVIETSEGSVGRLLLVNDRPPNADQRKQDDEKIQKLVSDPEERKHKSREQQDDAKKAETMMRVLPDAFLYDEIGRHGDLISLHFRPNPHFDPPTREASVYRGMEGTMTVDGRQKRLVRIDGHLFQDITFGWGILGRLDKGGKFFVEQTQIEGPRWEPTTLIVDMQGKALFFKSIDMHEKQISTDFRRVPQNLSLKQGADMLEKGPQIAENSRITAASK